MPEVFNLYSESCDQLDVEAIRDIAARTGAEIHEAHDDKGSQLTLTWEGARAVLNDMPAASVQQHLQEFSGWLQQVYNQHFDQHGAALLDRVCNTGLVVGFWCEVPTKQHAGAGDALLAVAQHMQALMFSRNTLYDDHRRVLLDPRTLKAKPEPAKAEPARPPAKPEVQQVEVELPPSDKKPTAAQLARYERTKKLLAQRKVPTLSYPLLSDDDSTVKIRTAEQVAHRLQALSVVTFLADGGPRARTLELIEAASLWPHLSPEERAFVEASDPPEEQSAAFLWRLEDLWVLAWALGEIDALHWPSGLCDVPRLVEVLKRSDNEPQYAAAAQLRSASAILDAQHLTMMIHWAVRDAWINKQELPEDLDWSSNSTHVPVEQCRAVGVVEHRHHALNWLIRFGGDDWDSVDTPT